MIAYETCNYQILNKVNFNCAAFNNDKKKVPDMNKKKIKNLNGLI